MAAIYFWGGVWFAALLKSHMGGLSPTSEDNGARNLETCMRFSDCLQTVDWQL